MSARINKPWVAKTMALLSIAALLNSAPVVAEDGYELWLRYAPLNDVASQRIADSFPLLVAPESPSPTIAAAVAELERGLSMLAGRPIPVARGEVPNIGMRGGLLVGEPQAAVGLVQGPGRIRRIAMPTQSGRHKPQRLRSRSSVATAMSRSCTVRSRCSATSPWAAIRPMSI
jgi:hypothetical protein